MYVIPSIDLMDGKCVKLAGNKLGWDVSSDPVKVAEMWEAEGAKILHIYDLDAALFSAKRNRKIVEKILDKVNCAVEVGGGVKSLPEIVSLLNVGAKWVILETNTIKNPRFLEEVVEFVNPKNIIFALNVEENNLVKDGWSKEKINISPFQVVKMFEPLDLAAYLFIDVEVEGTLKGVQTKKVGKLVFSTKIPVVYAGGVSSIQDLQNLLKIGVSGIVVGRALYEGIFPLKKALEIVKNPAKLNNVKHLKV